MTDKMKDDSIVEVKLHSRNKHQGRYDFDQLKQACPELVPYIIKNKYDNESIEFSNPEAVKQLNSALLKQFYDIANWDIPANYLCPPIPGRADYIHNVADLLTLSNDGKLPLGTTIKCLDIGVGANCIYPIIGVKEYGWSFVGSEIDTKAADFAKSNVASNEGLIGRVEIRTQKDSSIIFQDIIQEGETFDLSICNPPFHGSKAEANAGTMRKLSNLKKKKVSKKVLNFGGQSNELWCRGGELQFARNIIFQSKDYATSCLWFSTLLSKQSNLDACYDSLKKVGAVQIETLPMAQGNKISRVLAWTYLSKEKQNEWMKNK